MRRMSSADDTEIDLGGPREKSGSEIAYYGQSPASLSSQTSWHSDIDHGIHITITRFRFVFFRFMPLAPHVPQYERVISAGRLLYAFLENNVTRVEIES